MHMMQYLYAYPCMLSCQINMFMNVGPKYNMAKKWGIITVSPQWLYDSVERMELLSIASYQFEGKYLNFVYDFYYIILYDIVCLYYT